MFQRVFSNRTIPLALAGLVLLSYGLYIGKFGFYGDDWIYIYNYHVLGADGFWDFVAVDRPFSAWVYVLAATIFGESALPYHVLLLVLRWLSAVLVWWVLRLVWPQASRQAGWVAMLFAVYPGFLQQPIAVQYILHFSVLDLFLFSLAAMLLSVHHPRRHWLWMALGVLSSLAIFSLEYFAGLELVRPFLLWIALGQQLVPPRPRLHKVLITWLPYLLVFIAFGIWRVFIFKFPTYQPTLLEGLRTSPSTVLSQLFKRLILDLRTVVYGAWRQLFSLPADGHDLLFYGLLVGVTFGLLLFYLTHFHSVDTLSTNNPSSVSDQWAVQALILSVIMLLAAGLPFWVTFIRVELAFPWDRSTLPFMLGACLLVVSLLELVIQPRFQRLILAGMVALAVGFHYRNALIYQTEWQNLKTYFTQLIWRAPALKPGTILVSDDIPLWRYSDNDLTPLVNWIYAPDHRSAQNLYKYFDLSTRVEDVLPGYEEGLPVVHSYRNHRFASSTSQVLSIYDQLSQCLWVLSPADREFPGLPASIVKTLPISHLDQIIENAGEEAKLPAVFGKELSHDWCYYFEKADLARQKGDWLTAAALGEEAEQLGLQANVSLEYLPFIEGYAHTRNWQKASQYSGLVSEDEQNQPMLCALWRRVQESTPFSAEEQKLANEIVEKSGCR